MIDADLIAAATVGAAHRAVDLAALPEALRPQPMSADPSAALLDAAALIAVTARTAPALRPAARPEPPAPETRPMVGDPVRQTLARVVDHREILLEALGLIDRAGQRLPADLVPVLLDDPRPQVAAAAHPVVGEVGRWLIRKNPRWAPAVLADDDRTAWSEGTQAQRLSWLRRFRAADPAGARALLVAELPAESAADRALFLAVLADGLEAADEPLLMRAVQDRSRHVVPVALDLLTRLPGSRLRRDLGSMLTGHLQVHRGLLRTTVTVSEPDPSELGNWPVTDGLVGVIARIDPADWPALVGGDLLPLLRKGHPDLEPLRPGLRRAAVTFGHSDLAEFLLTPTLQTKEAKIDLELWSALSLEAATAMVLTLIEGRAPSLRIQQALDALERPYPRALALRLPAWLATAVGGSHPAQPAMWNDWAASVALADARAAADLARALAPTGEAGSGLLTRAGNAALLLTLRAVLAESLLPPGESR